MIFKIDLDRKIRDINKGIDTIPAFKALKDKGMKYIVLMYDYESPYSRLPIEIRKSQVLTALGYVNKDTVRKFFADQRDELPEAIERYKKLQYCPKHENLISVKRQMAEFDRFLRKENKDSKEMSLAKDIVKSLPDLIRNMQEIEELVGYRESIEEEEKIERTTLEEYMEGQQTIKR